MIPRAAPPKVPSGMQELAVAAEAVKEVEEATSGCGGNHGCTKTETAVNGHGDYLKIGVPSTKPISIGQLSLKHYSQRQQQ